MLASLSSSMKKVIGTGDSCRDEMKGNVKNLEDKMSDWFKAEGIQEKKKDYENLENNFEAESAKTVTVAG